MRRMAVGFATYLVVSSIAFAGAGETGGLITERVYLSGKGPSDAVDWEFYCSAGRRSGEWTMIPVPSNWEQHGFGGYDYGHATPKKHVETGTYRKRFFVPQAWKRKVVRLVIEGAMTETTIKLNGKRIGPVFQGGYLPHRQWLTGHLKYGAENELELHVAKQSSNTSLEVGERKADYWVFGGIYRPVYLEVVPQRFIHRIAIDARMDGAFTLDVFPQVYPHERPAPGAKPCIDQVVAQIETLDGQVVGQAMLASMHGGVSRVRLETQVAQPKLWSPEYPHLYQVRVSLKRAGETLHKVVERFGFRTFELRSFDGLYLNGRKLLMKGVNRNEFHPDTARAIDPEAMWTTLRAIKAMNANAVRFHLPPGKEFVDACDELGLLVICELTCWQRPAIDTLIARNLVHEIVTLYHNHPSVVIWANGNEGGFNLDVNDLYVLLDMQQRPVIHPWDSFDGLDTRHYETFGRHVARLKQKQVYLPTEMLHGLYDGGHGAGLDDYWTAIRRFGGAGGFLWCWADAGIRRTDQDGKIDTDGNHSADGIVGPYDEKEGSYYTIQEIWSPVHFPLEALPEDFDGVMPVENRFSETDLAACEVNWRLLQFASPTAAKTHTQVLAEGKIDVPSIKPGARGSFQIPMPSAWAQADALEITATNAHQREVIRRTWPTRSIDLPAVSNGAEPKLVQGEDYEVRQGERVWRFSSKTGRLLSLEIAGSNMGLANGPVLYAATEKKALQTQQDWRVSASQTGSTVVILAESNNDDSQFRWTLDAGGQVVLAYRFAAPDQALAHCAVGFDLEDQAVKSKRWLGDGPFRVWSNRRKGPQYGLWENVYNDGLAGERWQLPEFKGVFANVDWMRLELQNGSVLLVDTEAGSDVGVLRPYNSPHAKNSVWSYPEQGGLFMFHHVPAVGTKFHPAARLGPQSRPHKLDGSIAGRVTFMLERAD